MIARVPWDDHGMLCLLEACEKIGFPMTFHTISADVNNYGVLDEPGLPRLERVLQRFPKLRMFGHSQAFWSEIGGELTLAEKNGYPKGPVKPGGRVPELLRRYPNLYGDISAGSGLNALRRDPVHAYAFLEEFQDRLLFGLDCSTTHHDMPHIAWLTAARDARHISPAAYEKIMWQNIDRILGLGLG